MLFLGRKAENSLTFLMKLGNYLMLFVLILAVSMVCFAYYKEGMLKGMLFSWTIILIGEIVYRRYSKKKE
jgi:hypothetical protein